MSEAVEQIKEIVGLPALLKFLKREERGEFI